MRILHVIPQFPYFDQGTIIGGHASPLLTLARSQARHGDEVTILSYIQGRLGKFSIAPGLSAVSLFSSAKTSTAAFGIRFFIGSLAWAKRHRNSFDVAHVHSGFADYLTISRRFEQALRLPTIHTFYCPIPDGGGRVNRPIIRGILRRCARLVSGLTAISRHTARSITRFGVSRDILVVPPAIDLDRFYPIEGVMPVRRDLGIGDSDVVILFVGNAKPQKNLSRVLRAFRLLLDRHDNVRLVITTELAVASSDERLARLRQEMLDLGIEDSVTQLGIIDNMPELIRACDVLVAPFLDSFGPSDYFIAVLEAMASGKPTIVSAVGGMPEVINDAVGRLVDPLDHQSLGQVMIELAGNRGLRDRLGTQARDFCEINFSASGVADSFKAIYSKVI